MSSPSTLAIVVACRGPSWPWAGTVRELESEPLNCRAAAGRPAVHATQLSCRNRWRAVDAAQENCRSPLKLAYCQRHAQHVLRRTAAFIKSSRRRCPFNLWQEATKITKAKVSDFWRSVNRKKIWAKNSVSCKGGSHCLPMASDSWIFLEYFPDSWIASTNANASDNSRGANCYWGLNCVVWLQHWHSFSQLGSRQRFWRG